MLGQDCSNGRADKILLLMFFTLLISSQLCCVNLQDTKNYLRLHTHWNNLGQACHKKQGQLSSLYLFISLGLRKVQSHSKEHRKAFLNELSTKNTKAWQVSSQQAAAVFSESKESQRVHGKHKYYMKPQRAGAIKHILVLVPRTKPMQNCKQE